MSVSKQLRREWLESPVTLEILKFCKDELKDIRSQSPTDCIVWGEPTKTHENLVKIETQEANFRDWVSIFEGDYELFEEDEDE